jgi:hypothetical protein
LVGIHDDDQGDSLEIVPLGHHLRPHQDSGPAVPHRGKDGLERLSPTHPITIQAGDPHIREPLGQNGLDSFGPRTAREESLPAMRTNPRQAFVTAAAVAE